MSIVIDINLAGTGFSCRVWLGNESVSGSEKPTVKEAIHDAIEKAPFINEALAAVHLQQGNGLVCSLCKKDKTKRCSFLKNYECYISGKK